MNAGRARGGLGSARDAPRRHTKEIIDYETSMITEEDPQRVLLFY